MDTALHIPWSNEELENLLRRVVNTSETTKVDFKSAFAIGTAAEKAELVKDIQSFANSFDPAYYNHGFIILGAKQGALTFTKFDQNADKMQATMDQIVREHVGPFVPTQVRQFGDGANAWGVVVVPPSRGVPHIFVRDTEKYRRGDVYVRLGTTTTKAEPPDFTRFYGVHLENHTQDIREQLRVAQRELSQMRADLLTLQNNAAVAF